MRETYEFLALGGPVMALIVLCSVAATTLLVERLWALRRTHILPSRLLEVLREQIGRGRLDEARGLCAGSDSPLAAIVQAGLQQAGRGRTIIREVMQDAGRREVARMEQFMGALAALATISPLLGLLGTITGMIRTFQQVNQTALAAGDVSAGALANGIWEALITTAAGLTVAIPAYLMHRYLSGRIDRLAMELEETSMDLAERIEQVGAAGQDAA